MNILIRNKYILIYSVCKKKYKGTLQFIKLKEWKRSKMLPNKMIEMRKMIFKIRDMILVNQSMPGWSVDCYNL